MEHSAGIILYRENKESGKREYLVLKYANYDDYWGLCKGRIENDESVEQAAIRECQEETGLTVELVNDFNFETSYYYTRDGKQIPKQVVWFCANALQGQVKLSDEHSEFLWLSYKDAITKATHAKDRRVIEKVEDFLLSHIT